MKTHRGVNAELHRLTKDDPRLDTELRAFLGRTYNLKTIADYETGPGSEVSIDTGDRRDRGKQALCRNDGGLDRNALKHSEDPATSGSIGATHPPAIAIVDANRRRPTPIATHVTELQRLSHVTG